MLGRRVALGDVLGGALLGDPAAYVGLHEAAEVVDPVGGGEHRELVGAGQPVLALRHQCGCQAGDQQVRVEPLQGVVRRPGRHAGAAAGHRPEPLGDLGGHRLHRLAVVGLHRLGDPLAEPPQQLVVVAAQGRRCRGGVGLEVEAPRPQHHRVEQVEDRVEAGPVLLTLHQRRRETGAESVAVVQAEVGDRPHRVEVLRQRHRQPGAAQGLDEGDVPVQERHGWSDPATGAGGRGARPAPCPGRRRA